MKRGGAEKVLAMLKVGGGGKVEHKEFWGSFYVVAILKGRWGWGAKSFHSLKEGAQFF